MELLSIILIVVCGAEFILIAALFGRLWHVAGKKPPVVKEKDGVRYTRSDETENADGGVNASFVKGDILLAADEPVEVCKTGRVKPGRYTVLSTQSGSEKVALRINAVSRNQPHESGIILAEGDVIMAENEAVILR